MVQLTRKSNRVRFLTTKAKQLKETPIISNPIMSQPKKPILRSITTIDDNENTYNNLNFKKRKLEPIITTTSINTNDVDDQESSEDEDEEFPPLFKLSKNLLKQSDEDDLNLSENDNLFNSEDDNEYYSAISDYESDCLVSKVPQKRFINHSKAFLFKKNQDEKSKLAQQESRFLQEDNDLFIDSEVDSDNELTTPINSNFSFVDGDLKSLEENFQKIIDENHKSFKSSTASKPVESSSINSANLMKSSDITIDDFVDYNSDVVSSDEDSDNSHQAFKPSSKLLHYRHDEKHNLAFLDVSLFPIRYDPTVKNKRSVRALKRRAILAGKASEMVGTGMTIGEFNIF